ncbi:hypothetical protein LZ24_02509 [Desulfobotulus alkaliphilus]|uniref:Uncharacterized protein n=1 Tax=Desulfobotulus alkaliphilus TaxID=622671 RepID=A0A562RHG2_9BACT|nr:hypothetical protein LZ24_02509 [Desulfobotulus alkaliphilus]
MRLRIHYGGGARLCADREANPDCGFLPQHENCTQTGMECQDTVADRGKWEKITENGRWGLSEADGWGMGKDRFLEGASSGCIM